MIELKLRAKPKKVRDEGGSGPHLSTFVFSQLSSVGAPQRLRLFASGVRSRCIRALRSRGHAGSAIRTPNQAAYLLAAGALPGAMPELAGDGGSISVAGLG